MKGKVLAWFNSKPLTRRLFYMMLVLFTAVCLSVLTGWVLGADFLIADSIHLPRPTVFLIIFVLFTLQFVCKTLFIFHDRAKVNVFATLIFSTAYAIFSIFIFEKSSVIFELIPTAFVLVLIACNKNRISNLISAGLWYGFYFFFAVILNVVKSGALTRQADLGIMAGFSLYFELLIYAATALVIGGKNYAGQISCFPRDPSVPRTGAQGGSTGETLIQLITGLKDGGWRTEGYWEYAISVFYQWLVMAGIFALCAFAGFLRGGAAGAGFALWTAAWIVIPYYVFSGFAIKKQWHAKTIWRCTGLTAATIFGATLLLPDFRYSFFLPPVMGLVITYISYRVECFSEYVKEKLAENKRLKEYEETVKRAESFILEDNCDENALREAAKIKRVPDYYIDILVEFIAKAQPVSAVMRKFPQIGGKSTAYAHIDKAVNMMGYERKKRRYVKIDKSEI